MIYQIYKISKYNKNEIHIRQMFIEQRVGKEIDVTDLKMRVKIKQRNSTHIKLQFFVIAK